MKWFLLFFPLLAFAATPPQLPPPKVPDSFPYRLHTIQRATLPKPNTNYVHCTTNCPVAKTHIRLDWDHYGPGSQFISFEIWGVKTLVEVPHKLDTTINTYYERWFTNGPAFFITGVFTRDKDQAQLSKNLLATK